MRIEALYPELCNLYGDAMNVQYLARSVPGTELVNTPLRAEPAFIHSTVDLVYLGSMTESGQALAAGALLPYRGAIEARIDSGELVLATGNALELFGQRVEDEDGTFFDTLGLFDTVAIRVRPRRYNALYLGKFGETDIVGFNSRFSHTYGTAPALFDTVRGTGLNRDTGAEGFRRGGLLATYLLGPLLVLNPPFTRALLGMLGQENTAPPFEAAAMANYTLRLREFSDPKTGFEYAG